MKPARRKPAQGKTAGERRRGGRAAAKKRARVRARAARPKQKPRRTAKVRSRARRSAATVRARAAKPQPPRKGAKREVARPARRKRPAPGRAGAARADRDRRGPLQVVARSKPRASRPAPPPAFPQTVGASAKHQLLFRMVKARALVLAAIQGMSAAAAERPLGEGKWSTRVTILHLVTRDRARLREMEAALRGTRPSWDGSDDARQARANEEDLSTLRLLPWEDSVRLLLATRQQLMEAVESIPEEPADVWDDGHPLGWMFQRLPPHDLHHADIIKRRRTEHGA
jgi:hypothetical protein